MQQAPQSISEFPVPVAGKVADPSTKSETCQQLPMAESSFASGAVPAHTQVAADVATTSNASNHPQADVGATREHLLEQQVALLTKQLDQAKRMATLGELTSTTTHEFNNLLMTILNYAKVGMRHKDEATRDKSLQRIFDAATRAARVTSSVLAMARNRSGQMEPTDLKPIIEDAIMLLDREFKRYRVQLEVAIDEVPQVMAAGNELQRALINLLVNARQACREGGAVQVALRRSEDASEVILMVRDNGSGIPTDVLPRIFDPYFSTKAGPDGSGKGGTGLGLASCKETIDAHAGRIRVESTLGKGTAFIIRLPAIK